MNLYQCIEDAYMSALKEGKIPARLQLTEANIEELIQDTTLSDSWDSAMPDFWSQTILGMHLEKSADRTALILEQGEALSITGHKEVFD